VELPKEIRKIKSSLVEESFLSLHVVSGSMEPVIMTGDRVVVAPIASSDLRPFDIIVFWNSQVLICHYFWHINELAESDGSRLLVTRPLAAWHEDLPVPEDHVLGKVVSHRIPAWRRARILIRAGLFSR
jgi:signal peptidase I